MTHRLTALSRVFVAFLLIALLAFAGGALAGCVAGSTGASPSSPAASSQSKSTSDASSSAKSSSAKSSTSSSSSAKQSASVSSSSKKTSSASDPLAAAEKSVKENGEYTQKYDVAAYIHLFGHLPSNFISKTKARNAGWEPSKGNLQKVCPGKSIGGSRFYNDEGRLPDASRRTWTECDINYHGGARGAERIVFSNDGLVFYTGDHYETFEQLY